jgi:hypothetical protein
VPRPRYRFEWRLRPGRSLSDEALADLVAELRAVGETCLEPLPEYQVFAGTRDELSDKAITIARGPDGAMAGFCAAVLLDVPGVGEILHLGLTCVRPGERGGGLTHRLVSRLMLHYLVLRRPLSRIWVTNVAAVLSSLGNFACHFRDVFPAPRADAAALPKQAWLIAEAFDRRYRAKAHIQPWAVFDPATFVFRGSGRGTAFQKRADDAQYHHRDAALNDFYAGIMHFDDGDEVLQVGTLSVGDLVRYSLRRR